MNLVPKPNHASSQPSITALFEQRDSLKGRKCRHVKTFRYYYVNDVGMGGLELRGFGGGGQGRIQHKTWEQFARLYNLVDEDRGDAV